MKVVLFLGFSGSGKTWALTAIIRELTNQGFKVGTIKRIHEPNFSIDVKGKDTWRHASVGASTVLAVAPREIDLIRRYADTSTISTKEILSFFSHSKLDYLFVEGLHAKFERLHGIKRIVCARTQREATELLKLHKGGILFITGRFAEKTKRTEINSTPILSLPRDNSRAVNLIK